MANQYVALVGDVVDGITVFGPFPDEEDANGWCEKYAPDYSDWHTVELEPADRSETMEAMARALVEDDGYTG